MDKGCLTRAPRFSEQQRLGAWTSITRFERPGASEEDSSLEARRDIFRSGDSPRPHRVPFCGQEPSKDILADQFLGSSRNGAPELVPGGFFDYFRHRSEERRVGKECVSTGRSRWSP